MSAALRVYGFRGSRPEVVPGIRNASRRGIMLVNTVSSYVSDLVVLVTIDACA